MEKNDEDNGGKDHHAVSNKKMTKRTESGPQKSTGNVETKVAVFVISLLVGNHRRIRKIYD